MTCLYNTKMRGCGQSGTMVDVMRLDLELFLAERSDRMANRAMPFVVSLESQLEPAVGPL